MDATKTKTWPEKNEMGMGWTATYPRPEEGGDHHPALVALRQKQWDAAEELRQKYAKRADELTAKREAEEESKRTAAEAIVNAREQAKRGELEAILRRRFVAAGGTDQEWEAEKDEVVREHRRRQVAGAETADDAARQENARRYRAQF